MEALSQFNSVSSLKQNMLPMVYLVISESSEIPSCIVLEHLFRN